MSDQSQQAVVRAMAEVAENPVEGATGATIQVLIGAEDNAPNFATRRFTLASGGRIPEHRHPTIEHEQVVLEGEMIIGLDGQEHTVKAGDCIFIPAGVAHWYENRELVPVRFLCMVPLSDEYETEWLDT